MTTKETETIDWAAGYITVNTYTQKFIDTELKWYRYIVKRRNGTVVEINLFLSREQVDARIEYYQSISKREGKKILQCSIRYSKQKRYLSSLMGSGV